MRFGNNQCQASKLAGRSGSPRRFQPGVEELEERLLLSLSAVTTTNVSPWTGVVSIWAYWNDLPGVDSQGSGAFVDATHVFTAAHVVYNVQSHDNGGWADYVYVLLGANGSFASYDGHTYLASSVYHGNYTGDYLGDSDFAILTVPNAPAHFSFYYTTGINTNDLLVNSVGYPGQYGDDGLGMYQTSGYVNVGLSTTHDGTQELSWQNHPDDDSPGLSLYIHGQSGSPIIEVSQGEDIIVGVLSWSTYTGDDPQTLDPNGTGYATSLVGLSTFIQNGLNASSGTGASQHRVLLNSSPPAAAATTVSLSTNTYFQTQGFPVTLTATVSGSGRPDGSVTFYDNGNYLSTAWLVNGQASLTEALNAGNHAITATYNGSGNFQASNSTPLTVTFLWSPLTLQGRSWLVQGTSGNDILNVICGPSPKVILNGTTYYVNRSEVDTVHYVTGGGQDSVTLTGSTGGDFAALLPTDVTLTEGSFSVDVPNCANVTVNAGGGDSTANFGTSTGADLYVGTPTYSKASGNGYSNSAVGFTVAHAWAGGTAATAYLATSNGNDTLGGVPSYSFVSGANYASYAIGFAQVDAWAGGSAATAYLGTSTGNDTYVGLPIYSFVSGVNYSVYAIGFAHVDAWAGGANSVAYLNTSAGNDTFLSTATYSLATGASYTNYAIGFVNVGATAGGGNSTAEFYDSPGNDTFTGSGNVAFLAAAGYNVRATGFGTVRLHKTQGGTDSSYVGAVDYVFSQYGNWL